jgi:hypothetical protein
MSSGSRVRPFLKLPEVVPPQVSIGPLETKQRLPVYAGLAGVIGGVAVATAYGLHPPESSLSGFLPLAAVNIGAALFGAGLAWTGWILVGQARRMS